MKRFQTTGKSYRPPRLVLGLAVSLAVLLLFLYGLSALSETTYARQREALEDALSHGITHCYAVEGAYPESLDYLKTHYGLRYDESRFYVDYRAVGANIRPDVTIIEQSADTPVLGKGDAG